MVLRKKRLYLHQILEIFKHSLYENKPSKNAIGPIKKTDKTKLIQNSTDLNIKNVLLIIIYDKLCCIV